MYRFANQINVSITTNRTCNRRCTHCYILPHVFLDQTQMTQATFRKVFDKVAELHALDHNLEEVEWEVIGGETTLMPFEWWEEMLPYALERVSEMNRRLRTPGSLNFLTNLILKDPRYLDLMNAYAAHPAFAIYTSWEPDTNRFGRNDRLFGRFCETLSQLSAERVMMDIIMSRRVMDIGAKWILDTFVPLGVTDFSCKMISPYGSGKAYFDEKMCSFDEMAAFLEDMRRHKPAHVTFTPEDEMQSALWKGHSFQCNGNFYYDLAIEPDGLTTFNANQTAEEAVTGGHQVHLEDPDWAAKVLFENTIETNNKLTKRHGECEQCEYYTYCNAGWYHYKTIEPDRLAPFTGGDCPGLRRFWDGTRDGLPTRPSRGQLNHIRRRSALLRQRPALCAAPRPAPSDHPSLLPVPESAFGDYAAYIAHLATGAPVRVDQPVLFGKGVMERLWAYDARRTPLEIDEALLTADNDAPMIVECTVYGVLRQAPLTAAQVWALVMAHPHWPISRRLLDAAAALAAVTGPEATVAGGRAPDDGRPHDSMATPRSDLVVDDRNDELFRWLLVPANAPPRPVPPAAWLDSRAVGYLTQLRAFVASEGDLAQRVSRQAAA